MYVRRWAGILSKEAADRDERRAGTASRPTEATPRSMGSEAQRGPLQKEKLNTGGVAFIFIYIMESMIVDRMSCTIWEGCALLSLKMLDNCELRGGRVHASESGPVVGHQPGALVDVSCHFPCSPFRHQWHLQQRRKLVQVLHRSLRGARSRPGW